MTEEIKRVTDEPEYAESIRRWEAFWSLEDIGRPLWMLPTSVAQTAALLKFVGLRDLMLKKESQLEGELAVLNMRQALGLHDDFIPHVQPQGGVTVFASAFGCEVEFFDHTMPWAHPLIKESDPAEKVYELSKPSVTAGQLGDMLEYTEYFVNQTQGRYPVAITDVQGPLDTAYLVWEPSAFMVAMYTNPKEVHHLMRLVTDLFIDYVKEQRARSPQFMACHFPPLWLPDGRGISCSDDGLAVISAKLYKEFCIPYMNDISDAFGGIFVHSCGNFVHQFENLAQIKNLRGLNFGASETPFEAVWERFNDKVAIAPHLGLNNPELFETNRQFMEHVLTTKTHNRGLCVLAQPTEKENKIVRDPARFKQFLVEAEELILAYA